MSPLRNCLWHSAISSFNVIHITQLEEALVRDMPVELLAIEWYEIGKRIIRRRTQEGTEVGIHLKEGQIREGSLLRAGERCMVQVVVRPCESIVLYPRTQVETGLLCYEIGNRHLPLFFEEGAFLIPFDGPVFRLLLQAGYVVKKELRKLCTPCTTMVRSRVRIPILIDAQTQIEEQ